MREVVGEQEVLSVEEGILYIDTLNKRICDIEKDGDYIRIIQEIPEAFAEQLYIALGRVLTFIDNEKANKALIEAAFEEIEDKEIIYA